MLHWASEFGPRSLMFHTMALKLAQVFSEASCVVTFLRLRSISPSSFRDPRTERNLINQMMEAVRGVLPVTWSTWRLPWYPIGLSVPSATGGPAKAGAPSRITHHITTVTPIVIAPRALFHFPFELISPYPFFFELISSYPYYFYYCYHTICPYSPSPFIEIYSLPQTLYDIRCSSNTHWPPSFHSTLPQ